MNKLLLVALILFVCYSCNETEHKNPNTVPKTTEFSPMPNLPKNLLGQTVYIPIYSSIYLGHEQNLINLTAVLSIRNTSLKEQIIISSVDYYDTNGKLIKHYIDTPYNLGKMATKDFIVPEVHLAGGTGANFVVTWLSENKVSSPIIESVMLGTIGTHSFSFTSRGEVIEEH